MLTSSHMDDVIPRTHLIELSQVSLLKSYSAHFTLFDGHFVSVYIKTAFSKPKKYWIDLAFLEPAPRRVFKIDRLFFYITGAFSVTAALFMLINTFLDEPWKFLPVNIALICGALISFLLLIYRSKDRLVFFTRYGRINWLEFLINKPSRGAYKEFIDKLISVNHAVSGRQSQRHEQRLSAELHEHRRLRDAGVLPPEVYEDVKRRFLGQHGNLKKIYIDQDAIQNDQGEINSSNLRYVMKRLLTGLGGKIAAANSNNKRNTSQPSEI